MSTPDTSVVTATRVGLGYRIAIAVSILVVISTIMLASYACAKVRSNSSRRGSHRISTNNISSTSSDGSTSHHQVEAEPTVVVLGLDCSVIDSYTKIELGESKRLPKPNEGPCSICLSEYNAKDMIRCVPECNHCFHAECIDEWLRICSSCPLCRNSPAPSVVSTPVAVSSLGFN